MSRQELAEAVNGYLWNTHSRRAALDGNYVGKLERGHHRWPQAIYREAFRAVLGAGTDAEIGFYINRGNGTAIDGDLVAQPPPPHQELDTHRPQLTAALDSGALLRPWLLDSALRDHQRDERHVLVAPAGRFFNGQEVEAQVFPAVNDGRILAAVPAGFTDSRFLRRPRRGLVVGAVESDEYVRGFGLDTRQARRRLARAGPASRLLIPAAYVLDDLTVGILWAAANLDEPLLGDDALLADVLLFRHKHDYLQNLAGRFAGGELSRSFCIPPDAVSSSPPAERILLLLAVALMESFGIRINVCAEPEYAAVEGFVLDRGRRVIVANWVDADSIWQVGVASGGPTMHDLGDVTAYAGARSAISARTPARRLRTLADYLELDWPWLVRRCGQLGEYGCAGFAEPRSVAVGRLHHRP
ncbi:hypothetical protein [Micromonospora globbae]|uniref:hypothetical protein n=1 Tax=Micromonospora globbae TaxID=1894969 RepID=UPI0034239ECC